MKRVIARDIELTDEADEVSYRVIALDARTGKIAWQQEAHLGKPSGGRHRKNTYASETPVTDGERLYASFGGNVGLFCYSLDGTLLWKRTWTPQPIYLDFGTASSPVVHDGRVYLLHDTEAESFLTALDAKTGQEVWTRESHRPRPRTRAKSGWATPFVWENGQRTEIVTIGKGLVISYGTDGRELWRLQGHDAGDAERRWPARDSSSWDRARRARTTGRCSPCAPGATGDISLAEGQTTQRVRHLVPAAPLRLHPVAAALSRPGVRRSTTTASCRSRTRRRASRSTRRASAAGSQTFSSSPIAAGGRIYVLSEDGDTFVFEAGDEYRELAQNSLGEMSLATPAADADSLYVRTQTRLYRIRTAARP